MDKTRRNSSVEMLRIVAMLLIIAQHYVYHGGYDRTVFDQAIPSIIYLKILSIFGYSACTFFAFISGYYLVKANTEKGFYKKIIPLSLETVFYSVVSMIIALAFKIIPLSIKDIIKSLLPLFYGNWYVVFYILIYLFIPFINPFLLNLKKESFRRLLVLCTVLFIGVQTFLGEVYDLNNIDFMLISYFFGAYVRLFDEDFSYKNRNNLLIGLGCAFVIVLSVILMDVLGTVTGNKKFIANDTFLVRWDMIPQFFFSFFIFVYAVKKEYHNRVINLFASTVLGVYLIHDGLLKTIIWEKILPNYNFIDSPYLHSILKIVGVFVICSLIDLIRQKYLEKNVMKILKKTALYNRLP